MKAITIKQPWAALIAAGMKDVENRSQNWTYRGRIAIHSSQTTDWDAFNDEHVQRATGLPAGTNALGGPRWRFGNVIGVAFLAGTHRSRPGCCASVWARADARWHLRLHSAVVLPRPVWCAGQLGPWDLPDHVDIEVIRQLGELVQEPPTDLVPCDVVPEFHEPDRCTTPFRCPEEDR